MCMVTQVVLLSREGSILGSILGLVLRKGRKKLLFSKRRWARCA